ncbi:MAG: 30S ribosomal protein S6 [Thermincola sp.]|jgi:small subunit ribosomal protein S6|nr:30S ribosomal protein S6 [Thermincola sp.]MDT3701971.1 30S ribosomal protein S6 [Thermincola sp.]
MRAYEVMYIIRPDLDEEQTNGVIEKFKSLIENNGGEIAKLDKWGKRKLAYEINKNREGFYILMEYNGEAATTAELDRVFRITDEVVKYLIIREEE